MASAAKRRRIAEEEDMTLNAVGDPKSDAPVASLDCLPPEVLLHIFSWLDWRSLLKLERVSVRLRDTVALHIGRLRQFSVDASVWREFCAEQRPRLLWQMADPESQTSEALATLTAFLSRMVSLRELHADMTSIVDAQELLTAAVSASGHWPMLERLKLCVDHPWCLYGVSEWPNRGQLLQLCANCVRLTSVTLAGKFSDDLVEEVVTKLPALRTLDVSSFELSGSFLSHLPNDLHSLSVKSESLRSWPLADLLRCCELRNLELQWRCWWVGRQPETVQLVSVLVGCVHLERLSLYDLNEEFVACLPPDGLPTLRHLGATECDLKDATFGRLVEKLPGLESVSLGWCKKLTPQGLAPLGHLSSLSSLRLDDPDTTVSDWLLTQLSAAPLVELQLPALSLLDQRTCRRLRIARQALTVYGLLDLIRRCKSLRVLILSTKSVGSPIHKVTKELIISVAGVPEQDIAQAIRVLVNRLAASDLSNQLRPWWGMC